MRALGRNAVHLFKAHGGRAKRLKRALTGPSFAGPERRCSLPLQGARLQLLYEISRLLTRFESEDVTIPAVVGVLAQALPVQTSLLLLETRTPGQPRMVIWRRDDCDEARLESARAYVRAAYSYFVPPGNREAAAARPPQPSSISPRAPAAHSILLPLAVDRQRIFGALHVSAMDPFDEVDLAFVSAVANELAVAIAKQAAVEARQAAVERERAEAVIQHALAELNRRDAELKRAAAERAKAQVTTEFAFVRDVTASLGEGVIVVDLEERATLINPAAEKLLGCASALAVGAPVRELVQVRTAEGERVESPFAATLLRGELVRCEDSLFSSAGKPAFSAAYTCSPLWHDGLLSGAVLAFRDIAESKRSEKEQRILAEVSALLASSLEHTETLGALARFSVPLLADVCFVDELSESGSVQRVAVVFADERKQRELEATVRSYLPHPDWQTPEARVLRSGRGILTTSIEDAARDAAHAQAMRDGGMRYMLCVPLIARGKTLGVLSFVMAESNRTYGPSDLPLAEEIGRRAGLAVDNARMYEKATNATRSRDDLLAVVAHDLKNPLGVILMSIAVLQSSSAPDRRIRSSKPLMMIQRSAQRMDRLIRDLLDAAGIDAGHLPMQLRRVDVRSLVGEAVEALSSLAQARSIQIECAIPGELPSVAGDSGRLQQVLSNLLSNALKFTPPGGSISVSASRSGDSVTFCVSDTGPGVPESDCAHLFDRFWQAQRTAHFGSGLGLYIVKGIIEAHGGRVWVESKVGAGSAFFFTVPVADESGDLLLDSAPRCAESELEEPPPSDVERSARVEALAREVALRKRELQSVRESARVARELAERATASKNDFTSIVSHELRGPLTALQLLIERLQTDEQTQPSPAQQPLIHRMLRALTRLSALIESTVLYGLIQRGRIITKMETFSPVASAIDVMAELRQYAEEKGLELRLVAPTDLPPISTDRDLFRVILLHLVGNAVKFTTTGFVEVSIAAQRGEHRIAVRDSGPGIPAAERLRVFEPFEQLERTKRKHAPGLGLGLALIREVASALGGAVELAVASETGSTFTVTLPSMAQKLLESAPEAAVS